MSNVLYLGGLVEEQFWAVAWLFASETSSDPSELKLFTSFWVPFTSSSKTLWLTLPLTLLCSVFELFYQKSEKFIMLFIIESSISKCIFWKSEIRFWYFRAISSILRCISGVNWKEHNVKRFVIYTHLCEKIQIIHLNLKLF